MSVAANTKVASDLTSLSERIDLADMMRKEQGGIESGDEVLLAVIGFLEACKPRVIELIQAGTEGALSEEVFMQTLNVNDKLLALLSDEPLPTPPDPPPTSSEPSEDSKPSAAAAAAAPSTTDLLLSDTTPPPQPASASSGGGAFDLAAAAAASDPFAGTDSLLQPEKKPAAPLRAPSGKIGSPGMGMAGGGKMPGPMNPPVRAPSGGNDMFDTLPPPPPSNAELGKAKSEDLFDDFIGMRKNS